MIRSFPNQIHVLQGRLRKSYHNGNDFLVWEPLWWFHKFSSVLGKIFLTAAIYTNKLVINNKIRAVWKTKSPNNLYNDLTHTTWPYLILIIDKILLILLYKNKQIVWTQHTNLIIFHHLVPFIQKLFELNMFSRSQDNKRWFQLPVLLRKLNQDLLNCHWNSEAV